MAAASPLLAGIAGGGVGGSGGGRSGKADGCARDKFRNENEYDHEGRAEGGTDRGNLLAPSPTTSTSPTPMFPYQPPASSCSTSQYRPLPQPVVVAPLSRPNICPFCPKRFYGAVDLERHKRTHTGERPFPCPHCTYRSAQLGNLQRHMKNKHRDFTPAFYQPSGASSSGSLP